MLLDKQEIIHLYRRRAGHYDISANLYHLLGFREQAYRSIAVAQLNLKKGDTVVDIGCGTGLNFSLLQEKTGHEGRIIGVDLTDRMLAQAKKRIDHHGWSNIELVRADAADYTFPAGINGIISSFAITLIPEYDLVIHNGADALTDNGRFVILDLKMPDHLPMALVKLGVWLTRPFGVSLDLANRHPWESMDRCLEEVDFKEYYLGFSYIAVGKRHFQRL